MAEGIIGSLLLKIGAALAAKTTKFVCLGLTGEALALSQFREEITDIKEELLSIQGFLREAERFREKNENITNYVREIRRVAFEIEDIMDEFTYKLEDEYNEGTIARAINKIRHVKTWHQLTKKLSRIKVRIKDIEERRKRYDMSYIVKRATPQAGGSWRSAEDEHFVTDDLVGIEENKNVLIELLNEEKNQQKIISVWGMGGVGKTTLVTHVYKVVTKSFDARAWISVSQTWDKDQLLKNILVEFQRENKNEIITDGIDSLDHRSLVERIQRYLHNKRYLIILDDMWNVDAWRSIRNAFSSNGKIGRIILTTRIREVALLAQEQQIIEVTPLMKDHSWVLFCKTSFEKNDSKSCPPELIYWAKKIVERCCGLPLAILALAGLLACKEQNEWEWVRVYKDLEYELAQNPNIDSVNKILNLSFEELPYYLKNCLLYCSIFPEDHKISRKHLIMLWIAEGFIEKREKRTMEELAEDYLGELVSRCLLQVVGRKVTGRVNECTMHDIIRVLALSKSKEERFGMTCDNSVNMIGGEVRRLSVQSGNFERLNNDVSHIRSFLVFNKFVNIETLILVLRSFKLLRVLDLQGVPIKKLPKEVFNLFNLHFLGLRGTNIAEIPKSIGRLQNLHVLDARSGKIICVPKEITALKKLRYLRFYPIHDVKEDGSVTVRYVVVPKGIRYLKDLQTLKGVQVDDDLIEDLITLKDLRSLGLYNVTNRQCANLFMAISNMTQLIKLEIRSKDGQVLDLSSLHPSLSLQTLLLAADRMEFLSQFVMSLQNHKKLTRLLLATIFEQGILFYLQHIPNLLELCLYGLVDGKKLCFQEKSFPKLRQLTIFDCPHLNQIEIKRGAMTNIRELALGLCPELKDLPQGLQYLSNLEDLYWYQPNKCVTENVTRERVENQSSEARMHVLTIIRFDYNEEIEDATMK